MIRIVATTPGTLYGVISNSQHAAGTTTVTVIFEGSTALSNEALAVSYGVLKPGNPGTPHRLQGSDIASSTALGTDEPLSLFHDVTGTTTVTGLDSAGGDGSVSPIKVLQFDGALTLTHHATDLILPGGADITTAAGDIAGFYEYASGDWRCMFYTRAAAAPRPSSLEMATGTYTGDGSTSQAITGVGFQPKYVRIWRQEGGEGSNVPIFETTNTIVDDNAAGIAIQHQASGGHVSKQNTIISLDSDGFTVDDAGADADPNTNGETYNYVAFG